MFLKPKHFTYMSLFKCTLHGWNFRNSWWLKNKQTNNFFKHLRTLSSVVVSVHYNFWMESHFTVTSSCDCAIKGKFLHGEKKKWLRDSLAYSDAHSYEPVSEISPCFIENICFTVGTRWRGLSFTISGEIRAYFQPYINQKRANMCFC